MATIVWFYILTIGTAPGTIPASVPIGPFLAYDDCNAARYYQEGQGMTELSSCFWAEAKSRDFLFDLDEN